MTGHNHYADCTCGWCLQRRGRPAGALYRSSATAHAFRTFVAFTKPNASCPVCGAPVFFHQSPNGGRVFFDELGPPWPKHHCTDAGRPIPVGPGARAAAKRPPSWAAAGWEPVEAADSRMSGAWHVVPVHVLSTGERFEALAAEALRGPVRRCAQMMRFDGSGHGRLSMIDLDRPEVVLDVAVFERRRYASASPFAAAAARRGASRRK